jgi:hypothetical protein
MTPAKEIFSLYKSALTVPQKQEVFKSIETMLTSLEVDLNETDGDEEDTLLHVSAWKGHLNAVNIILDRDSSMMQKLDKSYNGDGIPAIVAAWKNGYYDIVKTMLLHPNTDINDSREGQPPLLWYVVEHRDPTTLMHMIAAGHNPKFDLFQDYVNHVGFFDDILLKYSINRNACMNEFRKQLGYNTTEKVMLQE